MGSELGWELDLDLELGSDVEVTSRATPGIWDIRVPQLNQAGDETRGCRLDSWVSWLSRNGDSFSILVASRARCSLSM